MSAMNTFTGRIFDPLKMMKQDVCVEDIAHALSLVCRGGGHIRYFFSVPVKQLPEDGRGELFWHVCCMTPVRLILRILSGR